MNSSAPTRPISPAEQNSLPLPGDGHGFVASEWKSIFIENGLSRVEDFFSASGNALSKPGLGKRYRAKLGLKHASGLCSVFYKRYAGEQLRSLVQRWLEDGVRLPIACREVRVSEALQSVGIATFKPLAWGWQGTWGRHQKSFVVMSELEGKSLERWLAESPLSESHSDWIKKKILVGNVAALARRFHGAGWFHRDFYLCHIFIEESGSDIKLSLLDLARVFRPRWRIERWLIKDLAQLDYSTPRQTFSRAMRLRFAKLYMGCDRLSPSHKSLLRKIAQRSKSIANREMQKRK